MINDYTGVAPSTFQVVRGQLIDAVMFSLFQKLVAFLLAQSARFAAQICEFVAGQLDYCHA